MKKLLIAFGVVFLSYNICFAQAKKKTTVPAKPAVTNLQPVTFNDSLSYAIGIAMATTYKSFGVKNINTALLSSAVKKVFAGESTGWTEDQIQGVFMRFESQMSEEKNARNIQHLDSLIAARFPQSKVVKLPSGLRYEVLREGSGIKPQATDTVVAHYAGTLAIDGKEFDNSYKRGEPATFPLQNVIKGWTEGLQYIPKGGKYRLFIPSQLGYGERGAGQNIPPNAALVFEVELVDVKKAN